MEGIMTAIMVGVMADRKLGGLPSNRTHIDESRRPPQQYGNYPPQQQQGGYGYDQRGYGQVRYNVPPPLKKK